MSSHEVVRAIRDLHRWESFAEFDEDRPGFLEKYKLTKAERAALLSNDVKALYEMGVHPMAVLFFGQDNHIAMPEYLARIGASEERVAQLKGLFGEGSSGATGVAN